MGCSYVRVEEEGRSVTAPSHRSRDVTDGLPRGARRPAAAEHDRTGEAGRAQQPTTANYSALGRELGPSSMQNFLTTVRRLRELAPHAVYDERLLRLRAQAGPPLKTTRLDAESLTASTASSVDVAAHLLARWISAR
jgi:hypothetical protein